MSRGRPAPAHHRWRITGACGTRFGPSGEFLDATAERGALHLGDPSAAASNLGDRVGDRGFSVPLDLAVSDPTAAARRRVDATGSGDVGRRALVGSEFRPRARRTFGTRSGTEACLRT